jgi:hypothetical protein
LARTGKTARVSAPAECSVIFGVVFLVVAATDSPNLNMVSAYALGGGIEFVIHAWLPARRRRHVTAMPIPA